MRISEIISVDHRYSRSVNMERDMGSPSSLYGYILSDRNYSNVSRILSRISLPDQPRAWTISGLYGTGKSAFGNYLLGLLGASHDARQKRALEILKNCSDFDSQPFKSFRAKVGRGGLVCAVATAACEPLSHTIVRALDRGATTYWKDTPGSRPQILKALARAARSQEVSSSEALRLVKEVATASKSGLVLLIDELGKSLEYAASAQEQDGLYLLQQIAEMPTGKDDPIVCVIGILHQAFSEYSQQLTSLQQREWEKIQGRFEDISFRESPLQLTRVISSAIRCSAPVGIARQIDRRSRDWLKYFGANSALGSLTASEIAALYPLHPIAALILPHLAERFAQNDRSIFTFLSSQEPHSLGRFLESCDVSTNNLPSLKLHNLYDYFIESLGLGMSNHRLFQRWAEIQASVADAERHGSEFQQILKTIGVLNLVSSVGELRANRSTVMAALVDDPEEVESGSWKKALREVIEQSSVIYRRQIDELRIWQGSDLDISAAADSARASIPQSSAELLNRYFSQLPLVASRHSYLTGNLRYFERRFVDRELIGRKEFSFDTVADGLLYYWIDTCEPEGFTSVDNQMNGRPILIAEIKIAASIIGATQEFAALQYVLERSPEIRNDGVARKELKHRLRIARDIVERNLQLVYSHSSSDVLLLEGKGNVRQVSGKTLGSLCSDVLDKVYHSGPVLLNELINRKTLTSQAAKARRRLLESMILNEGHPKLGLDGYGPERSIFESVFHNTGIYREREGHWAFGPPTRGSGIEKVWETVENFCLNSRKEPVGVKQLYDLLASPPYGARSEVVSLLLVAVLLVHFEDIVIYYQGSFIPALTSANLELLVKHPSRFSLMHFEIAGAKRELFKKLESIIRVGPIAKSKGDRNVSLLGVLKPLMRFVRSLPEFTKKTGNLNLNAMRVRDSLLTGRHPDKMIFEELPLACGLEPIEVDRSATRHLELFKTRFAEALQALETAYDQVLGRCTEKLGRSFSIDGGLGRLREHLRVRASSLLAVSIEPRLRRFLMASVEDASDDRSWLESLCMIIADKPVPSWDDEDERLFEVQLNEFARRFVNLEALDKAMLARFERSYDARRVVFTKPDGTERQRILWIDEETKAFVEKNVSEIMKSELFASPEISQAAIAIMLDRLLEMPDASQAASDQTKAEARKKRG